MRYTWTLVTVLAVLASPAAWAGTYEDYNGTVTNYNWLQLPPRSVTAFIGQGNASPFNAYAYGTDRTGSGNGCPDDFRSSAWVWIPNSTFTADGKGMYWAGIGLDQPRQIDAVGVQWWAAEGATLSRYYIDGWNAETKTWVQMGVYSLSDYTSYGVASTLKDSTRVGLYGADKTVPLQNPGVYQYIRVRVEEGDYTCGGSARGGPSPMCIEPMGSGPLEESKVNWVNQRFGTTITPVGMQWNNGNLNNGFLYDDETYRTGNGTGHGGQLWDRTRWIDINLGTAREIGEIAVVWDWEYVGTSFVLQYENEDGTYVDVVMDPDGTYRIGTGSTGMLGYTFKKSITAQYWRILNVPSSSLALINQVMMYSPAVPEPATMTLLALGGLALLRRRWR